MEYLAKSNTDPYLVTIVIGTYGNASDKLKLTVESILEQNLPFVKIVVVDDNGPGGEQYSNQIENYLNTLNVQNIWYVRNEVNIGVPFVFTKWISLVATRYFMITGEGDVFLPGSFHRMTKFLTENPAASMVFGLEIDIYDREQHSNLTEGVHDAKQFLDYRFIRQSSDYLWSQSSAMYRTDLFRYFKVPVISDWYWDFYFHCKYILHSKKIGFINQHIAKRFLDSDRAANMGIYDSLRGNMERLNTGLRFIDEHEFYLIYNRFPVNQYRYALAAKMLKQALRLPGNRQATMILAGNSIAILGRLFFNNVIYLLSYPIRLVFGEKKLME